ncbi:hypothetical protein [Cupriavidus sp. H18C1]|uniref:hypothetical protein n=1 Tax=Cupriavidus sp. H18C1 TaxID=3241601 RepID=UPI003BB89351
MPPPGIGSIGGLVGGGVGGVVRRVPVAGTQRAQHRRIVWHLGGEIERRQTLPVPGRAVRTRFQHAGHDDAPVLGVVARRGAHGPVQRRVAVVVDGARQGGHAGQQVLDAPPIAGEDGLAQRVPLRFALCAGQQAGPQLDQHADTCADGAQHGNATLPRPALFAGWHRLAAGTGGAANGRRWPCRQPVGADHSRQRRCQFRQGTVRAPLDSEPVRSRPHCIGIASAVRP